MTKEEKQKVEQLIQLNKNLQSKVEELNQLNENFAEMVVEQNNDIIKVIEAYQGVFKKIMGNGGGPDLSKVSSILMNPQSITDSVKIFEEIEEKYGQND